ncbi:damage-inducible protein CinA [Amylibacter kogurei]|uniref:Damage-inducible protein CinA n=1 Tax=Paramylibacter kogurei TaxID=1889778 RepID=A0A2G5K5F3_9RHOB|nr:CinA family protein [Amylibacter kogurei]PIB24777.1 damage-inducible protein CinA [Amylibacter kogurei]
MSELVETILESARNRGITIATAESCTAGMISAALTDVAGSSDVFDRGFVTYTNDSKQQMLGVNGHTLQKFGAVSEQVAREMCVGALKHSDANLAVAVTGIAGPGGSEHKPEGRVCFGVVRTGNEPSVETVEFGAIGRANVRQKTVEHALALLFAQINAAKL